MSDSPWWESDEECDAIVDQVRHDRPLEEGDKRGATFLELCIIRAAARRAVETPCACCASLGCQNPIECRCSTMPEASPKRAAHRRDAGEAYRQGLLAAKVVCENVYLSGAKNENAIALECANAIGALELKAKEPK